MSQEVTAENELQSFNIGLVSGLLEPKHVRNMGAAVWLYIWLIRKMTWIDEATRIGYVLGGKPVVYEDVLKDLGISKRNYRRFIDCLREHGYIITTRTPRGLIIAITKAKKSFFVGSKGSAKYGTSATSVVPESQHQKPSDVPKMVPGSATSGTSNIREGNERYITQQKKSAAKSELCDKNDKRRELLLATVNRIAKRNFRVLPERGVKKTLDAFTDEEIERALTNLAADEWHQKRLSKLSIDYLIRSTTLDRFVQRTAAIPTMRVLTDEELSARQKAMEEDAAERRTRFLEIKKLKDRLTGAMA